MRLLFFLSEIEHALIAQSTAVDGDACETQRMVNVHHGLARLTIRPRPGITGSAIAGTIFVQAFALADGSLCLKASLNWKGSDASPVIAVYATPSLNWSDAAARIASAWFAGPPAAGTIATTEVALPESTAVAS